MSKSLTTDKFMKRIYEPLAYSDRPIRESYWVSTVQGSQPEYPALQDDKRADFAVIGGGYTGLSAALTLAEAGADVVLLDAQIPGWGASGRAGGLVSTGSAKIDDSGIVKNMAKLMRGCSLMQNGHRSTWLKSI